MLTPHQMNRERGKKQENASIRDDERKRPREPSWSLVDGKCAVCGIPCTHLCDQCEIRYYCGVDHQRQDYKRHKIGCSKIKNDLKLLDNDNNKRGGYYGWWERCLSEWNGARPRVLQQCLEKKYPVYTPNRQYSILHYLNNTKICHLSRHQIHAFRQILFQLSAVFSPENLWNTPERRHVSDVPFFILDTLFYEKIVVNHKAEFQLILQDMICFEWMHVYPVCLYGQSDANPLRHIPLDLFRSVRTNVYVMRRQTVATVLRSISSAFETLDRLVLEYDLVSTCMACEPDQLSLGNS